MGWAIFEGYTGQCLIVDEEFNTNAAKFFDLLKDSDEPLCDRRINYNKLSIVTQVFTLKSDHKLSKVGYDRIVE